MCAYYSGFLTIGRWDDNTGGGVAAQDCKRAPAAGVSMPAIKWIADGLRSHYAPSAAPS
ncbi:hypothetical protein [Roseiflexus sp.]|uniref:hypothetical protein n=1 Tax=Roseiflexus sp. TaxID=2562120 RepID=UPI00398B3B82